MGFVVQNLFIILGSFSVVLFVFILFLWSTYNSFVTKRNQVKTDLSDVEIQVKRRASLVEQLVQLVKDYAEHEKETFEGVAKARSALDTSKSVKDTAKAENMLSSTLRSLFMVAERYPELKASQNFMSLRDDLKETENRIAGYREEYNRSVQHYNTAIQVFPNLFAAMIFNFQEEELFQP